MKFHKPFPGKPSPVGLTNLFVVRPTTLIKVLGTSFSRVFGERGEYDLYKKVFVEIQEGPRNRKKIDPDSTRRILERLMAMSPLAHPSRQRLYNILQGNQEDIDWLMEQGEWSLFLNGMQANLKSLPNALLLNVETACNRPQTLVDEEKFEAVSELLSEDELLSKVFWVDALEQIASCNNVKDLRRVQGLVAMEICLSHLAAIDAERSDNKVSLGSFVLPMDGMNPTQRFFRWLMREASATSISKFLDDPRVIDIKTNVTTLKRWSAGRYLPDAGLMQQLIDNLFSTSTADHASVTYLAARYLNFIGYFAMRCLDEAYPDPHSATATFRAHSYPFMHDSLEEWVGNRYPFWFEYHYASKEKGAEKPPD